MQDNPKITVITVFLALAVVMGAAYVAKNSQDPFHVPRPETPLPESPDLKRQFGELLKEFPKSVETAMASYKKDRKILIEALKPVNLREPGYVEQNYIMVNELIPVLRGKMIGVIEVFENTDRSVNELLVNQPESVSRPVLQEWDAMNDARGRVYIDYFSFESELLTAYDELMEFYYRKKGAFEVDIGAGAIVFKTPEDNTQAGRLQGRIKDLLAQQSAMLKERNAMPAVPQGQ